MSLHIWTPAALSSEFQSFTGLGWRLVEYQHYVSTLKIVDSLEEQRILETLVEETKPPLPPECQSLHFLLSTPFRYDPAYPKGSRFRRAGRTPGVYYAAMEPETAVAEIAFYRVLFFLRNPPVHHGLSIRRNTRPFRSRSEAGVLLILPPCLCHGGGRSGRTR